MIFRPLVFLLLMGMPLAVLSLLLRAHPPVLTRVAIVLGFVGGGVGVFFILLRLIPYGDGGGPLFSFLGAVILGAPLGAGLVALFSRFRLK